jgi:cobalamin synthase
MLHFGTSLSRTSESEHENMPSLLRFLTVVAVIVGVVYGAIFALANFVNPKPREMTVTVPADKFLKK